jgi:exodeoxyribonuclease V beta subunit
VRLARAALATAMLGHTMAELVALASDDVLFDRQCERLQQLHQTWKAQGVLAMVRRALHAFELPARWLAPNDPEQQGERRLTNVLQLAELLQAASAQAEGEQALVRWLAQQIADAAEGLNGSDDAVLRLESDADLVKVVTVHKSKGLEYLLVLLPFAAHFRELITAGEAQRTPCCCSWRGWAGGGPGGQGGRTLVLSPTQTQLAVAETERQREELRLLYVALTRARHSLWVGLSGLQVGTGKSYVWHRSAIGYLLSARPQASEQRIDVLAFATSSQGVVVEQVPAAEGCRCRLSRHCSANTAGAGAASSPAIRPQSGPSAATRRSCATRHGEPSVVGAGASRP